MVDFQSRDTRRDREPGTDEDGDEDEPESGDETAGDAETPETDEPVAGTAAGPVPDEMAYAVVTVGREQPTDADPAAGAVIELLEADGATVATREGLAATFDSVQGAVDRLVDRGDVTAVVVIGGVGVGPDDVTVEAIDGLFDKRLPGFGELFRVLSHEVEGTAVVRTRATAGVIDRVPVFCLPGDRAAAQRGAEQLVVPEAESIVREAYGPI